VKPCSAECPDRGHRAGRRGNEPRGRCCCSARRSHTGSPAARKYCRNGGMPFAHHHGVRLGGPTRQSWTPFQRSPENCRFAGKKRQSPGAPCPLGAAMNSAALSTKPDPPRTSGEPGGNLCGSLSGRWAAPAHSWRGRDSHPAIHCCILALGLRPAARLFAAGKATSGGCARPPSSSRPLDPCRTHVITGQDLVCNHTGPPGGLALALGLAPAAGCLPPLSG
jgi:hypothetical protein